MPIVRLPYVKAEFGFRSHTSVYNGIRAGLITASVPTGERSVGWPDYEVHAIRDARIAGQTDEQIRALVKHLHAKRTKLIDFAPRVLVSVDAHGKQDRVV